MTYDLNYEPSGPPKEREVYSGEDFVKKYNEALEVIKKVATMKMGIGDVQQWLIDRNLHPGGKNDELKPKFTNSTKLSDILKEIPKD